MSDALNRGSIPISPYDGGLAELNSKRHAMNDVKKAAKTILVAISEHIQAEIEKAMSDAVLHGAGFLRFGNDGTIRHVPHADMDRIVRNDDE